MTNKSGKKAGRRRKEREGVEISNSEDWVKATMQG